VSRTAQIGGAGRPAALVCAAVLTLAPDAQAVDFDDVGGEHLTVDISNTTALAYRFDNRNETNLAGQTLTPIQLVDDNYGEWLNRLYIRARYWKFSVGLRLDSAVFFHTFDRQRARDLIEERLGPPGNLQLENQFAREMHTRYTTMIYPAKLWVGFKHKRYEATLGDFYMQLGRGLVFSVRKISEVGIDTTVRGGKLKGSWSFDDFRLEVNAFGGQLNPIRLDYATGRMLHGDGSPLFFGFPQASDFEYFSANGPNDFEPQVDRAKPSYLEDTVVGGSLELGPKQVQFGANAINLFRKSNSEDKERCLALGGNADDCAADHPSFINPEATRSHDQITNFSGSARIPPIEGIFDAYVEVAAQNQRQGRVITIDEESSAVTAREPDIWGYAVYGNANIAWDPLSVTLEAKHYQKFWPLGGNIDMNTPGFRAGEYSIVTYSRPPIAEQIYTEPIGAPDVCMTGGRGRADLSLDDDLRIYGWVGRYRSFTEFNPNNNDCNKAPSNRSDTWDTAAGGELDLQDGKTHYWAWIGARFADMAEPYDSLSGPTNVLYREGYVRYDFNQHLDGPFSISALGYHRKRLYPVTLEEPWWEGENLLSLNWSPNWSFIFGYEYQTRPGLPRHYFNGTIQYRSKSGDHWYDQLTDLVRIFIGQRRAALRCVGGVCRVFPAFEGARLELVSTF
jgi:hypothetical protein